MQRKSRPQDESNEEYVAFIRRERSKNRGFGIRNAERWIGCKQLIDFLDDLLNSQKSSAAKLENPVGSSTGSEKLLVSNGTAAWIRRWRSAAFRGDTSALRRVCLPGVLYRV